MRFRRATFLLVLGGCGFPNVTLDPSLDSGVDATIADSGNMPDVVDSGMMMMTGDADADAPPPVTTGCKAKTDCAMTCTGKLVPGPCGCVAYLADSAAPFCDTTCAATGCLNKTAVCTDAGTCILQ